MTMNGNCVQIKPTLNDLSGTSSATEISVDSSSGGSTELGTYYILDFYCAELRLGIELDGEAHFSDLGKMAAEVRTDHLAQQGIAVIRFENKDVIARPAIVSNGVLGFADGARE